MDAESLKKSLEKELSLDSKDLRSHAWYHGSISRQRAEEIVNEEGGFLIRDCTSQPGNYVLTCRNKNQVLHFVINKVVLQPDTVYEKIQYQFEEEAFDTIPDLITFYVGSDKPITVTSDARIRIPKNRTYPLSFYASTYYTSYYTNHVTSITNTSLVSESSVSNQSLSKSDIFENMADIPPRLFSKKHRSYSLIPCEINRICQEKCNSADGVIHSSVTSSVGNENVSNNSKFSTHSLPRSPTRLTGSFSFSSSTLDKNNRNITQEINDTQFSSNTERRVYAHEITNEIITSKIPPPKPSRIPSFSRSESREMDSFAPVNDLQRITTYHASGSDSGNGSGDSVLSSAASDFLEISHRNLGVIIKNPKYCFSSTDSCNILRTEEFDYKETEEKLLQIYHLQIIISSKIDLENFHTILLPVNDNKPLDSQALKGVKIILCETGSRILANHLTRCDLDFIFETIVENENTCYGTDAALLLLSHGHKRRLDLFERAHCLKLLVAVTILTCPDDCERADMLNKWIEIAMDTKMALGNLYGFCAVMLGLCLPQIQKLEAAWHLLRQKHTNAAFNFEAKLRPTLKSMDNCSNPQAPNTTIPHLLPLILLIEKKTDRILTNNEQNVLEDLFIGSWESNAQDSGLSILHAHLEAARKFLDLTTNFQRNAEIVLADARIEELILDMFKTEFHLKLLWGGQGARSNLYERYSKFEKILDIMAEKYYIEKSIN